MGNVFACNDTLAISDIQGILQRFHLRVHKHTLKDSDVQGIMLNVSPCGNEHRGAVHSTRKELYLFIIRKIILALMKPSCSSSTAG